MSELIERTWVDIGCRVRALGRTMFVRTERPEQKTASGLLWLPPKQASFFGPLPHMRVVIGTVLSSGPKCSVKAGDRVCFQRLHFARWKDLGEDRYVGWIDENQLLGWAEYEDSSIRDEAPAG
jgi:co-chaperonin GroES (HSP10)